MNENYSTQNLYEASFLMAKGFSLAGKEGSGNKVNVLFEQKPEIKEEAIKFYNGAKIDAKKYSDCYRSLKDYIFTR